MCGIGVTLDTAGKGRGAPWALPLIRHRGPDGEGISREGAGDAALEHCRLAIIDPENPEAAQPFTDPSGRWVLLYNGELFNFRELRADLERRGVRFTTESDTEVVLHAFIRDGLDVCRRFRGMFAFVVYDRETGDLFAVRDQIGVKPLYWALRDDVFVAASEMRAMVRHPMLRSRLDLPGVIEYLAFGHTANEQTIVEGVRKLAPGHALILRDGRVEVREYWDVLPPGGPVDQASGLEASPEDYLRQQLEDAVSASLVSDVPVSLMLVGLAVLAAPAQAQASSAYLSGFKVVSPTQDGAHLSVYGSTGPYGGLFVSMQVLPETSGCVNGGTSVWQDAFLPSELDSSGHAEKDIVWTRVEGRDRHCLYTDTYTNNYDHTGWVLAGDYVFHRPVVAPPLELPPEPPPSDLDPPQTAITKHPPRRTKSTKAVFRFIADETGSAFRCKLDRRAFKSCKSPKTYRALKPGRHTFKVKSIDPASNADPTPARWTWKVVKKG